MKDWHKTFLEIKSHCWAILNVTPSFMKVCRYSLLPTVISSPHDQTHCLEPRQQDVPLLSSASPELTPEHIQLGVWGYRYCLNADSLVSSQCPTDDPIWQCMWSRIGGDIPEAAQEVKEMVLLSLDVRNCGYYWPLISDYYLFCMNHQNTLKYLAFPEIICCQSFSFEECFSCFIKPHPNIYWNWANNRGKRQGKR